MLGNVRVALKFCANTIGLTYSVFALSDINKMSIYAEELPVAAHDSVLFCWVG